MLMSAVVFIGITLIGGLWSSGLANIVSVTLIYLGIIFTLCRICDAGRRLAGFENAAPQAEMMVNPFRWCVYQVAIISWFVVMITQAVTAQGPVQIACGAKDEKQLEKAFLLGGLLIFPIGFLCAVLGLVAKVMFPEIPLKSALAMPKVIMSLNPVASGATLAAFVGD